MVDADSCSPVFSQPEAERSQWGDNKLRLSNLPLEETASAIDGIGAYEFDRSRRVFCVELYCVKLLWISIFCQVRHIYKFYGV